MNEIYLYENRSSPAGCSREVFDAPFYNKYYVFLWLNAFHARASSDYLGGTLCKHLVEALTPECPYTFVKIAVLSVFTCFDSELSQNTIFGGSLLFHVTLYIFHLKGKRLVMKN